MYCIECRKAFTPKYEGQLTCSEECRKIRHTRMTKAWKEQNKKDQLLLKQKDPSNYAVCPICNTEFFKFRSNQVCCCSEHQYQYRLNKARQYVAEAKYYEPKQCRVCGKIFIPKSSRQVTCSVDCSNENNKRMARKQNKEYTGVKQKPKKQIPKTGAKLDDALKALATYNKTHDKSLTYGEYMLRGYLNVDS